MYTIIGGDGKAYGPVSVPQLKQWIAEGRATLDTQARAVGSEQWHPLRHYPEFTADPALPPPLQPGNAGLPGTGEPGAGASGFRMGPPEPESIEFTAEWKEYFKIWIVNVLLTIVTLGVYAAWAKVRKKRYFYANTRVFGHTFEYLGDPRKIFYGNVIVVGMFALLTFSQFIAPIVYFFLALIFAIAVPWFIVRALMFNARNSAWRGLRFNFTGTYGGAFAVYFGWPLLVPFTLGLIVPLVEKKKKEFVMNHHAFGTSQFGFSGMTSEIYKIFGVSLLFFLPVIFAYFNFFVQLAMTTQGGGTPIPPIGSMLFLFAALVIAFFGTFYFRAKMFNYIWDNTELANNQFVATMEPGKLCGIHLLNALVTVLTFGLAHPWATIRVMRYQLGCLQIVPAGNIDSFVAAAQPPVGAVGDSAGDFFDLDIGFGA